MFVVVGVFFLGVSVYIIWWRRNIIKNGEYTEAKVIRLKRKIRISRGSSVVFIPTLRYIVNGRVHEVEYGEQGPIPKYNVNQTVRILYHREKPEKITDADGGMSYYVFSIICAIAGFTAVGIGLLS